MKKRKRNKDRVTLHPVITFIILVVISVVLSGILSLFNISFSHPIVNEARMEYISVTESINSLFSLSGIKYIFSHTVANFANFTVLAHLIIVLLGIGIMDYSGFLQTMIGVLTKKAKKNVITFVIVFICVISSIIDNIPFIAFIPLAALIFKYGKRNPNIGIIASFAGLTCGYGLSITLTSIDSSLSSLTKLAASVLNTDYTIGAFSMLFIMLIAIILVSLLITYITENIIAKRLPIYDFEETEILTERKLTKAQIRGLLLAGFASLIYLIIFIYNIIPGLPLSGNFLNRNAELYIDKLFGPDSFFSNGSVFIITLLFIIWGLFYGIGAKTIKNNREAVTALGYSLNGMGKTIMYIFAASTFISIFKQTNIGNVVTAGLSNLISSSGFTGLALVILLFACSAIATIFLPGTVNKWTIMSAQVIPTFLSAGLSGQFAQVVLRFGECATLGLTPVFAYFIVYLAYLEKYSQEENTLRLSTVVKYQVPYSIATGLILLVILVVWYLIGLPLGIGGVIAV